MGLDCGFGNGGGLGVDVSFRGLLWVAGICVTGEVGRDSRYKGLYPTWNTTAKSEQ